MMLTYALTVTVLAAVAVVNGYMPPPYYTSSLQAAYYILPLLQFNETQLEPMLSRQSYESRYQNVFGRYHRKMTVALDAWRKDDESEFSVGPILNVIRNMDKVPEVHRDSLTVPLSGFMNQACVFGCFGYNEFREIRQPEEPLLAAIEARFMTYEFFKAEFTDIAMNLIGSGYVWLVRENESPTSKLEIVVTENEHCPLSDGMIPLLVIDMWERAYYEQFSWDREAYIKTWWTLLDWNQAEDMAYFFSTGKLNPDSKKKVQNIDDVEDRLEEGGIMKKNMVKKASKKFVKKAENKEASQQTTPTQEL